ncbi:hypothetical protein FOZ62_000487, partial [Perkinsus olseni]
EIVDYRVTLVFNVTKEFRADSGVHRIRIEYPTGVVHNSVQRENSGTWFGVQISSELREAILKVELHGENAVVLFVKEGAKRLQVGQHSLNVPVTLPDSQPDPPGFNFYHLTFCRPTGNCTAAPSSGVLMTFPLHGFSLGDPTLDGSGTSAAEVTADAFSSIRVLVLVISMTFIIV